MTNSTPPNAERPKLSRPLRLGIAVLMGLGLAAFLYFVFTAVFHPAPTYRKGAGEAGASVTKVEPGSEAAIAAATLLPPPGPKGVGAIAPDAAFVDSAGKAVKLSDFKGKVVVFNLWATWCPPCRKEMPSLARLAASVKGQPIEIVALSIDKDTATDKAKAFIAENAPLTFYQDATSVLPFKFSPPVQGFPSTFVFDKTGRQRTMVAQDQTWDSEHVRKILAKLAAE
ncbi:TlpA disulfide reductase family protein [soil metagenome]